MTLPLVFSAASLILCGFFFIYFRGYLARRTGRGGSGEYRDEVEETRKLIADIDAATERDLTLIENRLKTLREVLDTADRRVAVFVRELDRTHPAARPAPLYTALGKTPVPAASLAPAARPDAPEAAVRAESAPPKAPQTVSPAPSPEQPSAGPSIGKKAAELAGAGFSSELIAARLGVSVSEVDLAITVYRTAGENGPDA
ncbi:MAG: hypothetical protein LBK08_04395 [Treponema sp.]|jgi:hypothetical protein|nr:hypothetical protein [Treponema sp.]